MARIIIAPQADADADGIFAYLATTAGGHVAAKYNDRFNKLYGLLADYPGAGAPRLALGANIALASSRRTSRSIGIAKPTTR